MEQEKELQILRGLVTYAYMIKGAFSEHNCGELRGFVGGDITYTEIIEYLTRLTEPVFQAEFETALVEMYEASGRRGKLVDVPTKTT